MTDEPSQWQPVLDLGVNPDELRSIIQSGALEVNPDVPGEYRVRADDDGGINVAGVLISTGTSVSAPMAAAIIQSSSTISTLEEQVGGLELGIARYDSLTGGSEGFSERFVSKDLLQHELRKAHPGYTGVSVANLVQGIIHEGPNKPSDFSVVKELLKTNIRGIYFQNHGDTNHAQIPGQDPVTLTDLADTVIRKANHLIGLQDATNVAFATAGYADVNDQEIDGLRRQLQLELNYSSANISILIPNANERHTFANDQEAVAKDIVPIISDALARMKSTGAREIAHGIGHSVENVTYALEGIVPLAGGDWFVNSERTLYQGNETHKVDTSALGSAINNYITAARDPLKVHIDNAISDLGQTDNLALRFLVETALSFNLAEQAYEVVDAFGIEDPQGIFEQNSLLTTQGQLESAVAQIYSTISSPSAPSQPKPKSPSLKRRFLNGAIALLTGTVLVAGGAAVGYSLSSPNSIFAPVKDRIDLYLASQEEITGLERKNAGLEAKADYPQSQLDSAPIPTYCAALADLNPSDNNDARKLFSIADLYLGASGDRTETEGEVRFTMTFAGAPDTSEAFVNKMYGSCNLEVPHFAADTLNLLDGGDQVYTTLNDFNSAKGIYSTSNQSVPR